MGRHWKHCDEPIKAPYHYRGCELDDIYLLSGYEEEETEDGPVVTIRNLEELHDAIGLYLAQNKKSLTGKELRFLRNEMDMTQADLGDAVRLSYQQVARWEKGESVISGAAEVVVRTLYLQHLAGKKAPLVLDLLKALKQDRVDPLPARLLTKDGHWKAGTDGA